MEYSYYKIDPTGNITAIVETPTERSEQSRIAQPRRFNLMVGSG